MKSLATIIPRRETSEIIYNEVKSLTVNVTNTYYRDFGHVHTVQFTI